jgi:hypothetical protein
MTERTKPSLKWFLGPTTSLGGLAFILGAAHKKGLGPVPCALAIGSRPRKAASFQGPAISHLSIYNLQTEQEAKRPAKD